MKPMLRGLAAALVTIFTVALGATPAHAATADYLLMIDGIPGESTHVGHEGEIELMSYSFGASHPNRGRAQFDSLTMTKVIDIASPKLFEAVATGKHYKKAVLTGLKSGDTPMEFLVVTLEDVLVSSYHTAAQAGAVATDQFTLNFATIRYTYIPQDADGSQGDPVSFCWNVAAGRACPVIPPTAAP